MPEVRTRSGSSILIHWRNIMRYRLQYLIFLAMCCDIGLIAKRVIAPVANLITDSLRIPGGIGTSFSLMFLVIAALVCRQRWCGVLMGLVQGLTAIALGMIGSMGALSIIGYVVPGLIIDLSLMATRSIGLPDELQAVIANSAGAVSAALTANLIVFRMNGLPLLLYLTVALTAGIVFGSLAPLVARRLYPLIQIERGTR